VVEKVVYRNGNRRRIMDRVKAGQVIVAIQDGLRRVNRLSAYVAGCSLAGLLIWLAESFTTHRWGSEELWVLIVVPLVIALFIRIVSWLLTGFFENSQE
jgi:hypothetical protein